MSSVKSVLIERSKQLLDRKAAHEKNLALVRHDGWAIKGIPIEFQTPEVCLEAVKQNGSAIWHVSAANRTPEVMLAAVHPNKLALRYLTIDQLMQPALHSFLAEHWDNVVEILGNKIRKRWLLAFLRVLRLITNNSFIK